MSKTIIRFARTEDCDTVLAFIKALAEYEKLADQVVATSQSLRDTLFPLNGKPVAEVLLLEEDGVAQGFALFFHSYSTFLAKPGIYLEDLFVHPHSRSKGYGKMLLQKLAEITVERGCGRLEWSVLDWNRLAIDFYEALGARPQDEWTVYRLTGEPLVRMAAKTSKLGQS